MLQPFFTSKEFVPTMAAAAASALLFLAAVAGSPFFVFLSIFTALPVFLVGLSLGFIPSAITAVVAFPLVLLYAGPAAGLKYLMSFLIPALVCIRAANVNVETPRGVVWYPLGLIVSTLALYMLSVVAIGDLVLMQYPHILEALQAPIVETQHFLNGHQAPAFVSEAIAWLLPLMPGVMAAFSFLLTLGMGALAQGILLKSGRAFRPTPPVASIHLPWWPWWMFAVCGVTFALAHGQVKLIAVHGLILVIHVLMIEGLGVIHAISNRLQLGQLFLWIFYGLVLLFLWPAYAASIFGIFEPWLRLRDRLKVNEEKT